MLEIHHLFKTDKQFINTVESDNWGHGPFVALQPGSDNIIQSVGFGWMIAFRKPKSTDQAPSGNSFNLGVGLVVDPNVQVLGDGIVADEPLPEGESEIRYKDETEMGLLFMLSFKF